MDRVKYFTACLLLFLLAFATASARATRTIPTVQQTPGVGRTDQPATSGAPKHNAPAYMMNAGFYGALRGDGYPYIHDGGLDRELIAAQARFSDVILDLGCAVDHPEIIAALREANPSIRLHAYVVQVWGNWPGTFFQRAYRIVQQNGGILYRTDGTPYDHWWNMTSKNARTALAGLIVEYLPGWDGLLLDVSCAGVTNVAASGIDYKRAGYHSEASFAKAWAKGHRAFAATLRQALGNRPLVGNCGPCGEGDLFNGWMRENFPFAQDSQDGWQANMIEDPWSVPGVLHERYVEPRSSWIVSNPAVGGPAAPENQRRMRFGYGSALLADARFSFGRFEGDLQWLKAHPLFSFPELELQLGPALSSAGQRPDSAWQRIFANGLVIVNPTDHPVGVRTARYYRPAGGALRRVWNVPPRDGLILALGSVDDARPAAQSNLPDAAAPPYDDVEPAAEIAGHAGQSCGVSSFAERTERPGLPRDIEFALAGANPVMGPSSLSFGVPASMSGLRFEIAIFDLAGRRLRVLQSGIAQAGWFRVPWTEDATLSSGAYFLAMRIGQERRVRKLVLVR